MVWDFYSAKSDSPTGADELLPVMILVVGCSEIDSLETQASLIRRLRHPSLLGGQEEYYLTVYESALEYISKLESQSDELADQMAEIEKIPINQSGQTP